MMKLFSSIWKRIELSAKSTEKRTKAAADLLEFYLIYYTSFVIELPRDRIGQRPCFLAPELPGVLKTVGILTVNG